MSSNTTRFMTGSKDEIRFRKDVLQDFYNKCMQTNVDGGEMLYTSFGPRTGFKVLRESESTFSMWQKDHMFTAEWKKMGRITSADSVEAILNRYPEAYAMNQFSHTLKHWDNYTNFLNAFIIKPYE